MEERKGCFQSWGSVSSAISCCHSFTLSNTFSQCRYTWKGRRCQFVAETNVCAIAARTVGEAGKFPLTRLGTMYGMAISVSGFYDDFASDYHLLFEDWEAAMSRQAAAIATILEREPCFKATWVNGMSDSMQSDTVCLRFSVGGSDKPERLSICFNAATGCTFDTFSCF
jgi:hypothetical protein